MPKPNYNLAKRQKEAARKARQMKKQDRRQGRAGEAAAPDGDATNEAAVDASVGSPSAASDDKPTP